MASSVQFLIHHKPQAPWADKNSISNTVSFPLTDITIKPAFSPAAVLIICFYFKILVEHSILLFCSCEHWVLRTPSFHFLLQSVCLIYLCLSSKYLHRGSFVCRALLIAMQSVAEDDGTQKGHWSHSQGSPLAVGLSSRADVATWPLLQAAPDALSFPTAGINRPS